MSLSLFGIGCLVFLATLCVDYAHAKYIFAISAKRKHTAARWSVAQWVATTIGFIVAVKVSIYLLPFEALGLYVGTCIAINQTILDPKSESQRTSPSP